MSARHRIKRAIAANTFGQAVTIVSQLVLTPLYFRYWGAELYGVWLLLSSVPAYLTMADMGVGSAAANEMTMRAGANDHVGAQGTYRSAMFIATFAAALALLVGVACALLWQLPQPSPVKPRDASIVIVLLSLNVGLGFAGGVISGGFRAAGRNATGISLSNGGRLLEAVVIGGALALALGPVTLCALTVILRVVMLLVQWLWLRQAYPGLFAPRVAADRTMLRRLLKPSLAFMALPLGNALALQAPLLIIGSAMGPSAVAMFAAIRTMARVPIQVVNVLNSSIWPELSRAHGAGDVALLRKLHRANWGVTVLLVSLAGFLIVGCGPWAARLWLGPGAPFSQGVLFGLMVVMVLSAVWNVSSVVLAAINAHASFGLLYVAINAAGMLLAWLGAQYFGWYGLIPSLALVELLLLLWVLPKVLALTGDSLGLLVRSVGSVLLRRG